MTHASSQRGSAFFIILIAIFILAALTYAFFRGGSTSTATLTQEQARLAAMSIIAYSDTIANAIQTLKLRGCKNEEISFESPSLDAAYDNPGAPTDESCHVFSQAGGKIIYTPPDITWLEISHKSDTGYGEYIFSDITCITDSACGGGDADLTFFLPWVKPEICMAINKIKLPQINLNAIPVQSSGTLFDSGYEANGDFDNAGGLLSVTSTPPAVIPDTTSVMCFESSGAPIGNLYVRVLLQRQD